MSTEQQNKPFRLSTTFGNSFVLALDWEPGSPVHCNPATSDLLVSSTELVKPSLTGPAPLRNPVHSPTPSFFCGQTFPTKIRVGLAGPGGGGRLHPTTTQTSARRCLHRLCAQTKHRFVFQPVRCLLGLSPCNLVSCERVIVSKGVFVCVCVCLCVCACACVRCASVSCVK